MTQEALAERSGLPHGDRLAWSGAPGFRASTHSFSSPLLFHAHMNAETVRSSEKDVIEVGLLALILELHPEHLSAADLIRKMEAGNPRNSNEAKAVERALESLLDSELVIEADGVIAPTKAALRFDELPF
jgi:hypothetical protein